MLTFYEIYKAYEETGLYNYLFESLNSNNPSEQMWAMNTITKHNFKNSNEVKTFVAMNI